MGKGDGLAVAGSRVIRFRAALPEERDFEALPRLEMEPKAPEMTELAGDAAIKTTNQDQWQVDPERLGYALVKRGSATAIQRKFGGSMDRARQVRDYAVELRRWANYWSQIREGEK